MDSPRASPRFMSMTKDAKRKRVSPPKEPEPRMSWQDYFMKAATLASVRSPCERLKVGCVLVKNNRLISMGYNGFLGGCEHKSIVRDGHEQATIHAEINAITDAAKRGASIDDCVAYVTHYPCLNCYKALASSGIKKIYYKVDYKNDPILEELDYGIPLVRCETDKILYLHLFY
jgi:dCMP deaminase